MRHGWFGLGGLARGNMVLGVHSATRSPFHCCSAGGLVPTPRGFSHVGTLLHVRKVRITSGPRAEGKPAVTANSSATAPYTFSAQPLPAAPSAVAGKVATRLPYLPHVPTEGHGEAGSRSSPPAGPHRVAVQSRSGRPCFLTTRFPATTTTTSAAALASRPLRQLQPDRPSLPSSLSSCRPQLPALVAC